MSPDGPLRYGESRSHHVRDRDGSVLKTITVFRTERPYVLDLCDAYNEARSENARARGVEWFVTGTGELKVGFDRAHSYRNAEFSGGGHGVVHRPPTQGDVHA